MLELKEFYLNRTVDVEECPWLMSFGITKIDKGTTVHEFPDVYGCCAGTAVSFKKMAYPYFELPTDSLSVCQKYHKIFSNN